MSKEKAGAFGPGHLSCTFARVPLNLITRAHSCGMPHKWAVLAYLCRWVSGDESGGVVASCSRAELCDALGISQRQAKNAIDGLKRDGLLRVLCQGHNGRASVYSLNVGSALETYPTSVGSAPETYPTGHEGQAKVKGRVQKPTLQARRVGSRNLPHKNSKKSSYDSSSLVGGREGFNEPSHLGFFEGSVFLPVEQEPGRSLTSLFETEGGGQ